MSLCPGFAEALLTSMSESHSGKAHKPTPPPTQHHSQQFIPKAAKPTGPSASAPQKVDLDLVGIVVNP